MVTRESGERDAHAGDVADDGLRVRFDGVHGVHGVVGVAPILDVVISGPRHLARAHGVERTGRGGVLRFCHPCDHQEQQQRRRRRRQGSLCAHSDDDAAARRHLQVTTFQLGSFIQSRFKSHHLTTFNISSIK